jgi:hypothetical protein
VAAGPPLTVAEFLARLHELCTAWGEWRWPAARAEAAWRDYYRDRLPWPVGMELRTWQRRMQRVRRGPPPAEVNPDHIADCLARHRSLLAGLRRSPIFGRADLSGEEAAIARMEAELAMLRRLGPAPRKRGGKKKR